MLEVARQVQVHLEISHFKLVVSRNGKSSTQLLDDKIRKAQAEEGWKLLVINTLVGSFSQFVRTSSQLGTERQLRKMCERLNYPSGSC